MHVTHVLPQISILIPADGHANVVRYFARYEHGEFIYLALERCECTLALAVARCAAERQKAYRRLIVAGAPRGRPAVRATLSCVPRTDDSHGSLSAKP